MNSITPAAIRAQMERILVSDAFVRSPRMQRFLEFIVEEKLAGRENQLGEYGVGTAVFDRGTDFEPATDPIVRNEARRLRLKLCEYYRAAKPEDRVLIDVPKGGYRPSFGAVAVGQTQRGSAAERRVVVLPIEGAKCAAFANLLTARLTNLEGIQTVAHRFVQDLNASHVVHGSAMAHGGHWRLIVNLTVAEEGTQLWAGEYEYEDSEAFQAHSHIAAAVVREVAKRLLGSGPQRLALVA